MSDAADHARILTHVADTISAGAILGTFLGILPPLAALAATLWYLVQIWESHTMQKWVRLHSRKRRTYRTQHRPNRVALLVIKQTEPPII